MIYVHMTLSFKLKNFLNSLKKRDKNNHMSKNETNIVTIIGLLLLFVSLKGEVTMGLLISIDSNSKLNLLNRNTSIQCIPFGIITLEQMAENSVTPKECQDHIDRFYRFHPHERRFAKEHLYLQQSYHFELLNKECVIYTNATESYSEILLRQGLAIRNSRLDHAEWNGKLKRAEEGAMRSKSGLHETEISKFCIKREK